MNTILKMIYFVFIFSSIPTFLYTSDSDSDDNSYIVKGQPEERILEQFKNPPLQPTSYDYLASMQDKEQKIKSLQDESSEWSWQGLKSAMGFLFYGSCTAGTIHYSSQSNNYLIALIPTYCASVYALVLTFEIIHFRNTKTKMNTMMHNTAAYFTDEQLTRWHADAQQGKNNLSPQFVEKIMKIKRQ